MPKKKKEVVSEKVAKIEIEMPKRVVIDIQIEGTNALILNRPDPETIRAITEKQTGKGQKNKPMRNLDREYESRFHRLPGGKEGDIGFPASGFQGAIMFIAKDKKLEALAGTDIQRHLRILATSGSLVPIEYERIEKVDDIVVFNKKTPDTARRPYVWGWGATLRVEYNPDVFTPSNVVSVIARAGVSGGIGAWRPSSKNPGPYGTWKIKEGK